MAIAFVRKVPASGTTGTTGGLTALTATIAFDATGCDVILVAGSYARYPLSNMSGSSATTATYAGSAMTNVLAVSLPSGQTSGCFGVWRILAPTTGTNNVVLTFSGGSGGSLVDITVTIVGYSGVGSIGNVGTVTNTGTSTTTTTASVSCSTGNLGVAMFSHGDSITGATGTTTLRALNNFSGNSGCGCHVTGENSPSGGTATCTFNSGLSDWWYGLVIELVAAGGGGTANTQTNTGSITATGAINKRITFVRGGSTTATGKAIKAVTTTKAGSTTATGLVRKAISITRAGSSTPSGTLQRQWGKALAGSITATGKIVKAIAKILTGSSTPSGAESHIKSGGGGTAFTQTNTGSITATGLIKKATAITRTGTSTPTAQLFFQYGRKFVGSVTATGLISKAVARKHVGSSTPTGALVKNKTFNRLFTGAITATSRVIKAVGLHPQGQVQPFGLLTSPSFVPTTDLDIPVIRTYYPGTDTPTRLALFDLDRLRSEGDADQATITDDLTTRLEVLEAGPLAAFGFHVIRTTNDASIANGAAGDVTFNSVVEATWSTFAGFSSGSALTVPADGGGIYVFSAGIYWAAPLGGIYLNIQKNTVISLASAYAPGGSATSDRLYLSGVGRLTPGDVIYLRILNGSGVSLAANAYAGDYNTPVVPFLRAWRIAR